jgi:hypothetical protein
MSYAEDEGIDAYTEGDIKYLSRKKMDNLIFKPILVSGIESANNKITLLEQETAKQYPTKYSFFQFKQGTEEQTKAYTQFLELGVSIGKVYEIAIKETQGVNKMSGKPITYRNIAYFKTGKTENTSTTKPPYQEKFEPSNDFVNRKDFIQFATQVKTALEKLNKEVGGINTILTSMGVDPKAIDLHTASHPKEEIPIVGDPDEIKIEDIPFN